MIKMKNIYCVIRGKYKKFKNHKISYILEKTVISIISSKYGNEDEKIFKKEQSIEKLKILGLIKTILLP